MTLSFAGYSISSVMRTLRSGCKRPAVRLSLALHRLAQLQHTGSTSVGERKRTYSSPMAFHRALTDKLKVVAETSRWNLPQLQRQMAYDRFLERLYRVDDGWVAKGATALFAREIGVRATIEMVRKQKESASWSSACTPGIHPETGAP